MTYTVHYKANKRFSRWKKFEKVKGDGILEHGHARFLILEDETRIEIPVTYIIKFGKERFYIIKEQMSEDANQEIRTKK